MNTQSSFQAEHDFFASRGFGQKIGFGVRPAVIVIDLAKGFTDPSRPLGSDLSSEIEASNQITRLARQRQLPVVFTVVRYDDPKLADAGIWALKQKGAASLMATGDGHELDDRLDVAESDIRICKKYASSFFGTDLLSVLVSMQVDTVILLGTSTSGCVRATAVDAVQMGLRPMVVKEGVNDRSVRAHEQSLFDLEAKYADVVSLEDTLAYLQTVGPEALGR